MSDVYHIPPVPSIRRFPAYLRYLLKLEAEKEWVSTSDIAEYLKLKPIQVRKDLALTGINGTPKKGYIRKDLILSIQKSLGWNKQSSAIIVGVGALGTALLGYRGFLTQGMRIEYAFDQNDNALGNTTHGIVIQHIDKLKDIIKSENIQIGIICIPQEGAQQIADLLVQSGIRAIWNFAPIRLDVPDFVILQEEDLASSLGVLTLKLQKQLDEEEHIFT